MKFNTAEYKLSLFTEDVCEDCQTLKEILKQNNIPFTNLSITTRVESEKQKKINSANRWDFIDAERDTNDGLNWFTPVMIVESVDGKTFYIPSVQDKVNCDEGNCINTMTSENVNKVLTPYLI